MKLRKSIKPNFNYCIFLIAFIIFSNILHSQQNTHKTYLKILGTVQDGGAPHIACKKKCCKNLSPQEKANRKITCLEIFQPESKQSILFEATPDIVSQWASLSFPLKGIFITHAHIGHYSGLLHLGREALGSKDIPVYVMPKMYSFLENNAPWSQLVNLKNIQLNPLQNNKYVEPLKNLKITPILVPHRDEFSETVGYKIKGPNKTILFIPDIDKWTLWEENLITLLKEVDIAFIDATFFSQEEVNYRPLSEIPHPLVIETIAYLKNEAISLKNKVYFIHMNHTNPMLDENSKVSNLIFKEGFNIARLGYQFEL